MLTNESHLFVKWFIPNDSKPLSLKEYKLVLQHLAVMNICNRGGITTAVDTVCLLRQTKYWYAAL